MGWVTVGVYGLFALVATLNLLLMRRPKPGDGPEICVLIPARDEAENLRRLLPALLKQDPKLKTYIFDDESTDGTGQIARDLGATVILPGEPLPKGWTGKNRACDALARAAAEDSPADWWLFLDADVTPKPGFLRAMRKLAKDAGKAGMLTGFPHMLPGRGVEPLFLGWVGWILLATNPFGLVYRTGKGHNRFKNGQIHLWRASVYTRLWPNERVKDKIMEDVVIGRLLAKEQIPVEVVNLSSLLAVKMYDNWRETLDGMSKNSFEITGSAVGSVTLSLFFFAVSFGWLGAGQQLPWALGLFVWSGIAVVATVRAAVWPILLMPILTAIGGVTVLRSLAWKLKGQTRWKGRVYP